jgi:hypothetical protein
MKTFEAKNGLGHYFTASEGAVAEMRAKPVGQDTIEPRGIG